MINLDLDTVLSLDISHIRCDGTVNIDVNLSEEMYFSIYGVTVSMANKLEKVILKKSNRGIIKVDPRMFVRTLEQELRQNGCNY